MSAPATAEAIAERYQTQRAHLEDLRNQRRAELAELAASRGALVLDVHDGRAAQADLDSLQAKMRAKTVESDQLRDSLEELDRREAAELRSAETARRQALRKDLDAQLARLAKANASTADLVGALAAAVTAGQVIEDMAGVIAGQLDLQLDSFTIAQLLPQALYENGIVLRPLNMVEKGDIMRAANRADLPGAMSPTARLRAKRVASPVRRMNREPVAVG
jgi:hypothetical protein